MTQDMISGESADHEYHFVRMDGSSSVAIRRDGA